MAARLARELTRTGLCTVVASLDDFYLRRSERTKLAGRVHPLLLTRGVPGTHDLGLLLRTLASLLGSRDGATTALPVFDKRHDDRAAESEWRQVHGHVDVAILEGWCIGARPQPPESSRSR